MGEFFRPHNNDSLWVYSERGLLSFLFHTLLDGDISLILDNSIDEDGKTLGSVVGRVFGHRLVTEFGLGANGFGSPDGGLFLRQGQNDHSFVFVEGKRKPFYVDYLEPMSEQVLFEEVRRHGYPRAYRYIKGFNSTPNGQLELRWRFVNSLLASTSRIVSERDARPPNRILANDAFYLRYYDRNQFRNITDWRAVNMASERRCLYDQLRLVERFFLLSVTPDATYPNELKRLRLYDRSGSPLEETSQIVFWMPLERIQRQMEVWSADRWRSC